MTVRVLKSWRLETSIPDSRFRDLFLFPVSHLHGHRKPHGGSGTKHLDTKTLWLESDMYDSNVAWLYSPWLVAFSVTVQKKADSLVVLAISVLCPLPNHIKHCAIDKESHRFLWATELREIGWEKKTRLPNSTHNQHAPIAIINLLCFLGQMTRQK